MFKKKLYTKKYYKIDILIDFELKNFYFLID